MANRQVTVSWDLPVRDFPAGTVAGNTHVEITGGVLMAPLVMDVASSPAVFAMVPEEAATDPAYTVTVQLFDTGPVPVALGQRASTTFSVLALTPVKIGIPGTVTVSVA